MSERTVRPFSARDRMDLAQAGWEPAGYFQFAHDSLGVVRLVEYRWYAVACEGAPAAGPFSTVWAAVDHLQDRPSAHTEPTPRSEGEG
jgi:hypothetical protein